MENEHIITSLVNNVASMAENIGKVCSKMDSFEHSVLEMKSSFDNHASTHEKKVRNLEDKFLVVDSMYKTFKNFSRFVILFCVSVMGFFGITNFHSVVEFLKK